MYVGNNPVNYVDPTGHRAQILNDQAIGGVYDLVNVNTNIVERTGRTNDFARREIEHYKTYGEDYRFVRRYWTDDYDTQRGLEEVIYNEAKEAGGGQLNAIKPISDRNPKGDLNYRPAAEEYLEKLKAAEEAGAEAAEVTAGGGAPSGGGGGVYPGYGGMMGGGGDGTME